jgi:diaminopimelate decarboxylase
MNNYYTRQINFYGNSSPAGLLAKFGSPLYVYNEVILRQRCREMRELVPLPGFKASYSAKANSNLDLLRIIKDEGLHADAMSPGEMFLLLTAGFQPAEIFFIPNNVAPGEMQYAIDRGIMVSVDSLAQLEAYGHLNSGGKVALRFNPDLGLGHHHKVVTGGKETKFGINDHLVPEVKQLLQTYRLKAAGVNQHLGSLFMDGASYLQGARNLLAIAAQFDGLDFVDFGGGFGIPYHKQEGQARLDLAKLGVELKRLCLDWQVSYGKTVEFQIEPGRYIVAECGVLLGTVHAMKQNHHTTYVGTDLGFNVLARPMLYNSHHELEVYPTKKNNGPSQKVTVVGNICETGDILAKDRDLPPIAEGDILGVMDAGAYGFSMSSNYNLRLRPAEVLIREDGSAQLIRRRETFEDMMECFKK